MNIRLFVFDFDGTALGGHEPYDRFPVEFTRFLDSLAKRGIGWATNTTWGVDVQYKVIKASGVKSAPAFLAGSSGRCVAFVTGRGLKPDLLYERRIKALDQMLLKKHGAAMRRIAARLLREGLADRLEFNPYGHNYIFVNFSDKRMAQKGWRLINPLLKSGAFYRITGGADCLGDVLLPSYMNKGAVLMRMQRQLGLKAEETMVAGDGWNDRHMFEPGVAEWMVCPANAHPGIKALARKHDGAVGRRKYSWGVIEAAEKLMSGTRKLK